MAAGVFMVILGNQHAGNFSMAAAVSTAASAVSGQKREPEKGRKQSAICDRSVKWHDAMWAAPVHADRGAGIGKSICRSIVHAGIQPGYGTADAGTRFLCGYAGKTSFCKGDGDRRGWCRAGPCDAVPGRQSVRAFYSGMEWNAAGQQVYAVSGEAEPDTSASETNDLGARLRMEFRS